MNFLNESEWNVENRWLCSVDTKVSWSMELAFISVVAVIRHWQRPASKPLKLKVAIIVCWLPWNGEARRIGGHSDGQIKVRIWVQYVKKGKWTKRQQDKWCCTLTHDKSIKIYLQRLNWRQISQVSRIALLCHSATGFDESCRSSRSIKQKIKSRKIRIEM